MLRLFTDTDCDITPADAAEYGYTLISMPYAIDGKTVYPYEDFDTFDAKIELPRRSMVASLISRSSRSWGVS